VTAGVVLAFVFSDWPRELVALSGAALLLVNRQIASTDMLRHVDGNLLLLLMGLIWSMRRWPRPGCRSGCSPTCAASGSTSTGRSPSARWSRP
jgi:hypothetical protein